MNWEQLLELAEMLAGAPRHGETRGRPRQTHLRKAISAAYYAMFHAVANSNADSLIGATTATRRSEAWTATHRALNHGTAKQQMMNGRRIETFHNGIQDFSDTFVVLQLQRHDADYNPNPDSSPTRLLTLQNIQRARDAINAFFAAPLPERRRFATHLLFPRRN